MRRIAGILIAAACLAPAPAAGATDPASLFDAPGEGHANVCVHLTGASAPLRFGDATETGFDVTNALSFYSGECPDGTVRLDLHELIPSSAGPLAFHRGGNGYNDADNVKYGELATSDLADPLPPPTPSSGGRGAPCTVADGPAYQVDVQSIPREMHYKRPQDVPSGSNSGASFLHYGDPGADQGDNPNIHYTYLLWSFLDVRGGGHVRTLLAPNQVVRPCDVDPITMSSWDSAGNVNGEVTARYVRVLAGTCPLYGWMVWSHTYFPDSTGPVSHATQMSGQPPADPQPDPSCPVAEPPSAPIVATTGATDATGGAWTLAGTTNPKGVPTSFHFDYGLDTNYGQSTPEGTLGAADNDLTVSIQVAGLQPATTYHYRLVATNTHGTGYGADQSFTTAPPPPPPPPPVLAISPPIPRPLALTKLRVSPTSFRRAHSRRGTTAHVRFAVSAPARVTLTFLRATPGIRRGHSCRRPPHGRVSRHAHRCTRWVELRGSIVKAARAGLTSVGFGGWLARRPLAPGRYRVRAVALDTSGQRAPTLLAGFRLRSR